MFEYADNNVVNKINPDGKWSKFWNRGLSIKYFWAVFDLLVTGIVFAYNLNRFLKSTTKALKTPKRTKVTLIKEKLKDFIKTKKNQIIDWLKKVITKTIGKRYVYLAAITMTAISSLLAIISELLNFSDVVSSLGHIFQYLIDCLDGK